MCVIVYSTNWEMFSLLSSIGVMCVVSGKGSLTCHVTNVNGGIIYSILKYIFLWQDSWFFLLKIKECKNNLQNVSLVIRVRAQVIMIALKGRQLKSQNVMTVIKTKYLTYLLIWRSYELKAKCQKEHKSHQKNSISTRVCFEKIYQK